MELTKSEQEIIEHIKSGLRFRQIAKNTELSVTETCRAINALYEKFHVTNRLDFIKKVKG